MLAKWRRLLYTASRLFSSISATLRTTGARASNASVGTRLGTTRSNAGRRGSGPAAEIQQSGSLLRTSFLAEPRQPLTQIVVNRTTFCVESTRRWWGITEPRVSCLRPPSDLVHGRAVRLVILGPAPGLLSLAYLLDRREFLGIPRAPDPWGSCLHVELLPSSAQREVLLSSSCAQ